MRFYSNKRNRIALACVIAAAVSTTGCKTGWKMPGKDMFGFSKKPSESTLAGKGPSTTYPQNGPAANHTPNQIASASPSTPKSTAGVPTYGQTAATANGYPTGPYTTNPLSQPNLPPLATPGQSPSPAGSTASAGSAPGIYGGANPYGYRVPSNPYAPAGTAGSLAATATSQPPAQLASVPAGANLPQTATYTPNGTAAMPAFVAPGLSAASTAQTSLPVPGPTPNAGFAAPNMAGAVPASGAPAGGVPSTASYAGGYRPGSTGRPSNYDFSTPGGAPAQQPLMANPQQSPTYPSTIIR